MTEIESLRQQLTDLKSELKTIGKAIDDPRTDLTMTMSEIIIEQKKQLAAALAACKIKDAALQSAISAHKYESGDLHDALAVQPDDAALQAFAAIVREQCAQVCEEQTEGFAATSVWDEAALSCAKAIRARGESK